MSSHVIHPSVMLIKTEAQYQAGMAQLELLEDTTPHKALEIDQLSAALEAYENDNGHAPVPPDSLIYRIERYLYEHRLQKQELATLLGITNSRLSEVLNGKRAVNMDLARRIHLKLGIEAEFILLHA